MTHVPSRAAEQATNLHEAAAVAMAEIRSTRLAPDDRPAIGDVPMSRSSLERRERGVIRLAEAEARGAGCRRAFAEVAYRASPLGETAEASRAQLIADAEAMAAQLGVGDPVGVGVPAEFRQLAEESMAVSLPAAIGDDMSPAAVQQRAADAVSAACEDPEHPLTVAVEAAAREIERRTVDAARAARGAGERLEEQLDSIPGDGEEAEARRRLLANRHRPALMESLFQANFRIASSHAPGSPDAVRDLALAEAVSQYALVEAANAFGLIPKGIDAVDLAREISRAALVAGGKRIAADEGAIV